MEPFTPVEATELTEGEGEWRTKESWEGLKRRSLLKLAKSNQVGTAFILVSVENLKKMTNISLVSLAPGWGFFGVALFKWGSVISKELGSRLLKYSPNPRLLDRVKKRHFMTWSTSKHPSSYVKKDLDLIFTSFRWDIDDSWCISYLSFVASVISGPSSFLNPNGAIETIHPLFTHNFDLCKHCTCWVFVGIPTAMLDRDHKGGAGEHSVYESNFTGGAF